MPDAIASGALSHLNIRERQPEQSNGNELGQDVFLRLMVTQMENQNPLDPQENSEFVAQLAQFSSVEGLDRLNNTMDDFVGNFQSSQALQASSMVGRKVKVDTDVSELRAGDVIAGTIDLTESTNDLSLVISDQSGVLLERIELGGQPAGQIDFVWDGVASDGGQYPPGIYTVQAFTQLNGRETQVGTALSANVDSVTVGANGAISLNVANIGPVSLSGVREIL